jgi:hypothetical protein
VTFALLKGGPWDGRVESTSGTDLFLAEYPPLGPVSLTAPSPARITVRKHRYSYDYALSEGHGRTVFKYQGESR